MKKIFIAAGAVAAVIAAVTLVSVYNGALQTKEASPESYKQLASLPDLYNDIQKMNNDSSVCSYGAENTIFSFCNGTLFFLSDKETGNVIGISPDGTESNVLSADVTSLHADDNILFYEKTVQQTQNKSNDTFSLYSYNLLNKETEKEKLAKEKISSFTVGNGYVAYVSSGIKNDSEVFINNIATGMNTNVFSGNVTVKLINIYDNVLYVLCSNNNDKIYTLNLYDLKDCTQICTSTVPSTYDYYMYNNVMAAYGNDTFYLVDVKTGNISKLYCVENADNIILNSSDIFYCVSGTAVAPQNIQTDSAGYFKLNINSKSCEKVTDEISLDMRRATNVFCTDEYIYYAVYDNAVIMPNADYDTFSAPKIYQKSLKTNETIRIA